MTYDTMAPVALFVYNRLDNTRKTIDALRKNKLAEQTVLYVFSDGGKDEASWGKVCELREYLETITGFAKVHLVYRPENYYLERNITEGIAQVLETHDRLIVLEDDIVTSSWFLTFMNDALTEYKDVKRVWHVSAFTNLCVPELGETYLCNHMSGWGWGTWRDRWQNFRHYKNRAEAMDGMNNDLINRIEMNGNFPCLKSLDKSPMPWDICWEIAIYKANALCLNPTRTLVKNVGLSSGTHFSQFRIFGWYDYDRQPLEKKINVGDIPIEVTPTINDRLAIALKDHGMRYNCLGKIVRFFYLLLLGKNKK